MPGRELELRTDIRNFILNNFYFADPDRIIGDNESLIDHGVVDSTGVLELIDFLEERYGISIENEEVIPENLDSIKNMCNFVMRKK